MVLLTRLIKNRTTLTLNKNNMDLTAILICVVLPIAVILIVSVAKIMKARMHTQVMIKAIEANNEVDAEKIAEAFKKQKRSERELLNLRLLRGCLFGFIGIALITLGIVSLCTGTAFAEDPVTVPLTFGGASLAVGLSYIVVYFVTRRQITD